MSTATKTENGSIPPAGNVGTPAGVLLCEQKDIKLCVRMNVTCISRKGYTCLHSGACQPCNAGGEVLTDAGWTAYPRRGGMTA
jgi:hypothetical protein